MTSAAALRTTPPDIAAEAATRYLASAVSCAAAATDCPPKPAPDWKPG
jgi:hypothetical protein